MGVTLPALLVGLGAAVAVFAAIATLAFAANVALFLLKKLTMSATTLHHNNANIITNMKDLRAAGQLGHNKIYQGQVELMDSPDYQHPKPIQMKASFLLKMFQGHVNNDTKVAKRSDPNQDKPLNANKVVLSTIKGERIHADTIIALKKSQYPAAVASNDALPDIMSWAEDSGYVFFRTFNHKDKGGNTKAPIRVKLV